MFLDSSHARKYTRQESSERVTRSSQRPLPTQHQQTEETNTHALRGIRKSDSGIQSTAFLRLIVDPRLKWDPQ